MDLDHFSSTMQESYADYDSGDDITELARWYIEEMQHYRKYGHDIALDMLTASIHLIVADGGYQELENYVEHLRAVARRLEIRINRHKLGVVQNATNDDR